MSFTGKNIQLFLLKKKQEIFFSQTIQHTFDIRYTTSNITSTSYEKIQLQRVKMVDCGIFKYFDKPKMIWDRWLTRFEGSYAILAPKDDKKQGLLLHYIGMETYDLLCDKLALVEPEQKTYERIKSILQKVFDPTPLEIVENYRFHLRKQADDESVEEFSIALRKLAIHCNFGNYLDTALRNQFVFGLRSSRIQNRLLETDKITVDSALTTAKAMELSAKGGAEIQQQKEAKQSVSYVNQKSTKKSKGKQNQSSHSKEKSDDTSKKNEFCFVAEKKIIERNNVHTPHHLS